MARNNIEPEEEFKNFLKARLREDRNKPKIKNIRLFLAGVKTLRRSISYENRIKMKTWHKIEADKLYERAIIYSMLDENDSLDDDDSIRSAKCMLFDWLEDECEIDIKSNSDQIKSEEQNYSSLVCNICLCTKNDFVAVSRCKHVMCSDCIKPIVFSKTIFNCPFCKLESNDYFKIFI